MGMVETLIPMNEYLHTAYHPDCDYVDGQLVEGNMGERSHSITQREFLLFFGNRRREWNVFVFPEQRIQVSVTRFRVPDVCVYLNEAPREEIFQTALLSASKSFRRKTASSEFKTRLTTT